MKIGGRHRKEAVVIEGPTTTEMLRGNNHLVARVFEHLDRGLSRFRREVVVKCIRPEHDLRDPLRMRSFSKPRLKCLGSKSWNFSLVRYPDSSFRNVPEYGKLCE